MCYTRCCVVVLNDTKLFLNFTRWFLLANPVTQLKEENQGEQSTVKKRSGGRLVEITPRYKRSDYEQSLEGTGSLLEF